MIGIYTNNRADWGCLKWIVDEMIQQKLSYYVSSNLNYKMIDAVILLGDRSELLLEANKAVVNSVPIIHIGGGEVSGNYDNSIRKAISKLSNYHFVVNEKCKDRLNEIGEYDNIYVVGSPRIDYINKVKLESKVKKPNIIYHPETLESLDVIEMQTKKFFDAIEEMNYTDYNLYLPNSDRGCNIIINEIRKRKLKYIKDENIEKWIDKLYNCSIMIGNSSAGIMEAQVFGIPVVNVGNRQQGRETCNNVFHCGYDNILDTIEDAMYYKFTIKNIYGNGTASQQIVSILKLINKFEVKK